MDPYLILGIEESATDEEVRAAYQRLVRSYTPEKSPEIFQKVNRAYKQLENEVARAVYKLRPVELDSDKSLADLIPEMPIVRRRVGVDAWLDDISEVNRG